MSQVKICGLRRLEDIDYVNRYRPDYAGFILSQPFHRYTDPLTLKELTAKLDRRIKAVGVFVNEPAEYIQRYLDEKLIDIVQLHGGESEEFIQALKRKNPLVPVIRSFEIKEEKDAERAVSSCADIVLLDSGKGSGQTFRWSLIESIGRPYILAGGLNPENVKDALGGLHPYGVDTSSGVESEGVKDEEKIRAFIQAVRNAEENAL